MGRHRKKAASDGDVRKQEHVKNPAEVVEERLGLTKQICTSCDARNPERADVCRKCGHTGLRQRSAQYRDG